MKKKTKTKPRVSRIDVAADRINELVDRECRRFQAAWQENNRTLAEIKASLAGPEGRMNDLMGLIKELNKQMGETLNNYHKVNGVVANIEMMVQGAVSKEKVATKMKGPKN